MGGAHRWQRLISELPDDIECRVLCPPPAFPYGEFESTYQPIKRETIDGVPVTRLWTVQPNEDSRAHQSNLGRILNYVVFSVFASLYVLVNFWRYDCIVTVSSPHTTFLPGAIGKLLGCSWVVDIFDLWLDNAADLGYAEEGSLAYRYIWTLEWLAITKSDGITVITETMAQAYVEKFDVPRNKFTLVPFGVDGSLFTPSSEKTNSNRVLYVGNMGDAHALRPFIAAFQQLPSTYSLELVGDGKRRTELEEFADELGISDRIQFSGFVARTEVAHRLQESALSIVPLQQDFKLDYARPNKLLESMAVGTPYVASDIREIRRVTEESGGGLVVSNDSDAVANAIRELLEAPDRRERMGQNAVSYIESQHRWSTLGNRVSDAIKAAC
ncbi:glycosyltransferase family 4 protein [Halobacterium salinarum]|uniref:glycosyltransferase family 4 protein n=1 Tax=Halobacterium salinarum TaxID=2242 RepID=UPI002553F252|nr:glycosyltransferase family 4 protein [Halobacterium salinarum]MDL0138586.1 glycosyltransferase family 4 protein [Halobacterium salinarum]